MTKLLDGLALANIYKEKIKATIKELDLKPRLDVVLVGDDGASKIYIKKKCESCDEVGIKSKSHIFSEKEFLHAKEHVTWLSCMHEVSGILVQLPLPKSCNPDEIFDIINPLKDVDVFSPTNVGLLVQNRPRFLPPTPLAVQKLILDNGLTIQGKHVVVINRSNVVGKPLSSMLIQDNLMANATVTVCHDNTPPEILKQICLSADIIVVAVGIPGFLTVDMIKEHQIVIDVGITRVGKKVLGDAHPSIKDKVMAFSPVPGGVGPLTVAMLLYNTVEAAKLQKAQS